MRKPDICLCENKGADQLSSNCEADQRLCFCYTDSTIPLVLKSEILNFQPPSVAARPVCVRPGRKPRKPVFSRRRSIVRETTLSSTDCWHFCIIARLKLYNQLHKLYRQMTCYQRTKGPDIAHLSNSLH